MKRPWRPASSVGRRAFWLAIGAAVWGLLFPSLGALGRAVLGDSERARIMLPTGMVGVVLELALTVAALLTGIRALRGGERSWLVVLGFALAVIVGGFWILFALGEVLVPH